MTAVLQRPGTAATQREPQRRRWSPPAGWPIGLAVAGYPIWWYVGITPLLFILVAAVLLVDLLRRGPVRVPPGFWIWLTFLGIVLLSAVALNQNPPDTIPSTGVGRFVAFAFRLANYASMSVLMLYLGNVSERELPRLRVARWMGLLAVWTILLGTLGVLFPRFTFPTLLSSLLPHTLADALGGTKVALAQVQPVLGVASPRPAAPFAFTNAWGNSLSLLLVWLVLAGLVVAGRRTRLVTTAVLLLAVVPIVYSLNRGMWIGLCLSLVYVAFRLAARGRVMALGAIGLVLGVAVIAFLASPLQTLVSERLSHGHSNETRTSLATDALKAAATSPVIGYGSTRQTLGSDASIAVGQTADCPKCGNRDIGSTGQFFLLLIAQGFLGTAVYIAYFLRTAWAFRRDASPVGIAGTLVLLLSLFYGLFYTALLVPLMVTFVSIGLLWRNAQLRAAAAPRFPVARARG